MDKTVLEIHLESIQRNQKEMNDSIVKLFEKAEEMNLELKENTIVLKQHHRRSTKLEEIQLDFGEQMQNFSDNMKLLSGKLKRLDETVKPIKAHVDSMDVTISWIKTIPTGVKIASGIVIFITGLFGIYHGSFELVQLVVKLLK